MHLNVSFLLSHLCTSAKVLLADQPVLQSEGKSGCISACEDIYHALPNRTFVGDNAKKELWSLFQSQIVPQCRVQPVSATEVAEVLQTVRDRNCKFSVLGGGTSPFLEASNVQDGVTIDLSLMNSVELINDQRPLLKAGGGAIWADVYAELGPHNLSAAGTRNSLTGVVGSILGGGISFFSQHHGWICDTVLEFEVVLANGSTVLASETANPDLFWALRGGGANFGIVTSVTLEVFQQGSSWYMFQLWNITDMRSVFQRLDDFTRNMPLGVEMIATNLGWSTWKGEFVLSDRIVASTTDIPEISRVPLADHLTDKDTSRPIEEYLYRRTTLEMAQVMDLVNEYGYFNFFGSITVQSHPDIHMRAAEIFQQEASKIRDVTGIKMYIVYNPVTISSIQKMRRRGGNALGLEEADGPLIIININLHWSSDLDTPRLRFFMEQILKRIEEAAKAMNLYHPYQFLSHCYEEQKPLLSYGKENLVRLHRVKDMVDPNGIFQTLQVGKHKLGMDGHDADDRGDKMEL